MTKVAVYVVAGGGALLAGVVLPFKAMDVEHSVAETVFGGVSGLAFIAAGLVARQRRPDNRVGLLMVLVGLGFFAEDVRFVPLSATYTVGLMLGTVSSGFIAHLVLAFPDGHLSTRPQRWLVAIAYATVLGLCPLGALFVDPSRYGQTFPSNLVLVSTSPWMLALMGRLVSTSGAVVAAGVVIVLARRWISATPPRRRVLAPVFLTALVGGLAALVGNAVGDSAATSLVLLPTYRLAFCLLPLAFLTGVLRVRLGRSAVAALLVDLQRPLSPSDLRDRLAEALGDRTLQIGYWRPEVGDLVDADGTPLPAPLADDGRMVTYVEQDGQRVAGLIHDAALVEDPHVLRAVTAAAGLTMHNQRLTAEVRAQLSQVRASRARIVTAVTQERQRMERDLHDGVQQSLVAAALGVRIVTQRLADTDQEVLTLLRASGDGVDTALADLRRFARGIHPAILADDGLVPALQSLVERTPVAVELEAAAVPRLPAPVEATAYLVVAEALTNAMKHAHARLIRIAVSNGDGRVRVEVVDDGVGGADADGSGLLGIADRVRALDGDLVIRSEPGRGTSVAATLPSDLP